MRLQLQEDGSYVDTDLLAAGTPNAFPDQHPRALKWLESNTADPYIGPTDMELCMAEISRLESTVTPRRMRDAFANTAGKDWIANVESLIAIERGKL